MRSVIPFSTGLGQPLSTPGPGSTFPLIGRDQEITAIQQQLAATNGPAGVLLVGPSGIGKTRLAEEVIAQVQDTLSAVRLDSHLAKSVGPSATENHCIQCGGSSADHALVAFLENFAAPAAGSRPRLLIIDDAHYLSPSAVKAVGQLARSRQAKVLLTTQAGVEAPTALQALWKEDHIRRINITRLSPVASQRLACAMSDNRLTHSTAVTLARLADGNPLLLRELVRSVQEQGLLEQRNGLHQLRSGALSSPALYDLIAHRLPPLGTLGREALEMVGLSKAAQLSAIESLFGSEVLVQLEERQLIEVTALGQANDRAPQVRCAHPLVEHVIRQEVPPLRSRRHLRAWADVLDLAALTDQEKTHLAAWHADVGETAPCEILADAVRSSLKFRDFSTATRLAEAHWNNHPSLAVAEEYLHALLGDAAFDRFYSTVESMARKLGAAAAPALARFRIRALLLEENFGKAEEELDCYSGPDRDLLIALSFYRQGRLRECLDVSDSLLRSAAPEQRSEAITLTMLAQCSLGRPADALATFDEFYTDSGDSHQIAQAILEKPTAEELRAIALGHLGRRAEAEKILRDFNSAPEAYVSPFDAQRTLNLGIFYMESGNLHKAVAEFTLHPAFDPSGAAWRQKARIFAALSRSWLPEGDRAQYPVDALGDIPKSESVTYLHIAHAWRAHSEGNEKEVVSALNEAIKEAFRRHQYSDLATAIHNAARLGHAKITSSYWEIPLQGPLLRARLQYAQAVATNDAHLLEQAAMAFSESGTYLYAAEAFAELARLYRRAGNERNATSATSRAHSHLRSCGPVDTPPLRFLSLLTPLSERERTIAILAVRGMSDKEIAERLVISPRTVGNTLYRIYQKAGVTGRKSLRKVLDTCA
ncbi:AAA family ATPase [Streptomyces sp. NPDC053431]|uniref:helix-turn-helix transcriptional regulator n=1 Tax=Streptomyces sp. NPDC053431 TaxID=3365703 RepID=UPI0037D3F063